MELSLKVPDVLRARGRPDRAGWVVAVDGRGDGTVGERCIALESCDQVTHVIITFKPRLNDASAAIKVHLGIINIVDWNDDPERTVEEVVNTPKGRRGAARFPERTGGGPHTREEVAVCV